MGRRRECTGTSSATVESACGTPVVNAGIGDPAGSGLVPFEASTVAS